MMKYHQDGTLPPDDGWIFVFGSNMWGRHGKGAARIAVLRYGAQEGVWFGPTGRAFAIPTKLAPQAAGMSVRAIGEHVERFLKYARERPDVRFWVTAIGCGLAGHQHQHIAPLFATAPANCSLPEPWHNCAQHSVPQPDREHSLCSVCWART